MTRAHDRAGVWAIRTVSGSWYYVTLDADGQWWCTARNVPNPRSVKLPECQVWPVAPPTPWPPIVGQPMALLAPLTLARDDPWRMPGGGKFTSAVVAIRSVRRLEVS